MKTKIFIIFSLCIGISSSAQSPTWDTQLNAFPPGVPANFGTLTSDPILFHTANQQRMVLDADGNLQINALAGTGDQLLMVDKDGYLKKIPPPTSSTCGGIVPWSQGGNTITFLPTLDIGTCNNVPFILKSNNNQSVFVQPSGKVGIGTGNNNPSQIPILDVWNPSGGNTNHFKIHGDINGAIESSDMMGLYYNNTFGIHNGSPGNSTPYFSIDFGGSAKIENNLDIGTNMFVGTGARLGVDGQTSDGIVVIGNNSHHALNIANSNGAGRFRVWINAGGGDDTKTHIAGSTQIGFYNSPGNLVDNNTRLNVDASNINGIKVTTNSHLNKMLHVNYNGNETFLVTGSGKTHIGAGRPLSTGAAANAMLSVDGMILAKDIRVAISTTTHWADYVFEKDYKLMSLNEVEKFVNKNKHLPGVPSAEEVVKEGVDMATMDAKLLEKIEELTLYMIDLKKEVEELKNENKSLKVSKK